MLRKTYIIWTKQGVFGRLFLLVDLGSEGKNAKKSKLKFTISFLVNAAGEETPIVIWKSEKPRCFKRFDINSLPVKYYHQKNAWMTGAILHSYLTAFN